MRIPIAFFVLLLASAAQAQDASPNLPPVASALPLPSFPSDCVTQIESNGLYCSRLETLGNKIHVTFVGIASKEIFPEAALLINRYLDFPSWPDFVNKSPQSVVSYHADGSKTLPSIQSAEGVTIYRQYYDYDLKVQGIPLLKQTVKGVTYNWEVPAYEGALKSMEFQAQPEAVPDYPESLKGMKSQIGSVHVMECAGLEICDGTSWVVIFDTTVEPDVSFAMAIAGKTIKAGIEDILNGILVE